MKNLFCIPGYISDMEKLPCEVAVWNIVPAIRAAVAQEMVSAGVLQKDIARMLQIQPSAVSQYLSGKRGYRIIFSDDIRQEIRNLAENLIHGGEIDISKKFCSICTLARDITEPCDVCSESPPREEESG